MIYIVLISGVQRGDSVIYIYFHYRLLQDIKWFPVLYSVGLPRWLSGKESTCQAVDVGSIPGLGISPGGGNGNLLQ